MRSSLVKPVDTCNVTGYDFRENRIIRNFLHKGLKRLNAGGNTKGVPSAAADKLTKMLAVLEALRDAGQLRGLQFWKPHLLTGDRKGIWSLSVTRNWRPTYWINDDEPSICDLDLEDYH